MFQQWPPRCRIAAALVVLLSAIAVPTGSLRAQQKPAEDKKPAAKTTGTPESSKPEAAQESAEPKAEDEAAEEEHIPITLEPYKVRVNLSVANNPRFDLQARQLLVQDLSRRIQRTWGGMWQCEISNKEWIGSAETVRRLTAESVSDIYGDRFDKVMFVAIDPATRELAAVEWDWRSNSVTVPAYSQTYDTAALAGETVQLLLEVFQPVLTLERVDKFDKSYIEMSLKAGELGVPDPAAVQVQTGDVLTPYVRFFNKRNRHQVDRIQPQILTYIVVQDVDRARVGGTLISGVPTVFGKNARRAEQFALRKRPRHRSTRLKLVLRSNPDKPLLSHRVHVVPKLKYRDTELAPPLQLISDRYGEVEIPVGSYPTYWVYVYSGKLLLARIPYAPGLVEHETVLMPDDSMRLLVEGEVDLLKGRLIDLVARRAVHMSAALAFAKQGKADEAKAELAELSKLPGLQDFLDQITNFRRPAVIKAEAARNRVSRGRILKVCKEIENVLRTYFDPEKDKAFRDRLDEVFGDEAPDADDN